MRVNSRSAVIAAALVSLAISESPGGTAVGAGAITDMCDSFHRSPLLVPNNPYRRLAAQFQLFDSPATPDASQVRGRRNDGGGGICSRSDQGPPGFSETPTDAISGLVSYSADRWMVAR